MATIEAEPTIETLELAGFASWPCERTTSDGSWQIRLSPKLPYKRTNSINCLNSQDGNETDRRLGEALSTFAAASVPPTLRITPLTPPSLIDRCSGAGWSSPYSESLVMTASLGRDLTTHEFEGFSHVTPEWIADYMSLTVDKEIDPDTITQTLSSISTPVRFLRASSHGACTGVAVCVANRTLVGIFGLAVAKNHRKRGIGRALSETALAWGVAQGADIAWLQVEADNNPAIKLYESLGFSERYRYAYRTLQSG